MKVFVTGATGFVGSAVVQELLGAGHSVVGLARSEASAQSLAATGAEVLRGSLDDLDALKAGATASEGVIHTAFNHDFTNFMASCEQDRLAIETLGAALEGSDRPLLVTSGVALIAPGRIATEDDPPVPVIPAFPRASGAMAAALRERGLRASEIRLAPSVHGERDGHGFIPMLIKLAREKGVSAYIGDGSTRWSAVDCLDAAHLYRMVLEKEGPAAIYHAIADEAIPFREIAEKIGRHLGVPVVSKSSEEAPEHYGWMVNFFALDFAASSAKTQEQLGWRPTRSGLLADLDTPHYFA